VTSIEDDLSALFSQIEKEQNFKANMSTTFAYLVGAVIFGFFVVALWDETVRVPIFSHESGIQFITLFSLVIAIILFGIVGILEGKELAALLGGLSGYILGRGTGTSRAAAPQPAVSPATAPPIAAPPIAAPQLAGP
jgi:hypothetical protein